MRALTKEEFATIVSDIIIGGVPSRSAVVELLDAHEFWREAVKRVDPCQNYHQMCQWCESIGVGIEDHKPECAWLMAHE